ncbi:single-stranded-DNA-specific exonuclease RecJ [Arenibaculum pallidiluteum]|uniref:single-stranded-DNA-specific exonuclease RecJ n=1 Tax=Arenibaculum pallidiluteum TaxID=2812559 RepID=UPI001A95CCE9
MTAETIEEKSAASGAASAPGAQAAHAAPVAFLNVERSATGRRWLRRPGDERQALAMAQGFGLPEMVARAMAARGVTVEAAETYLAPTLRALLPDPSHLRDMDVAAERIARAVETGERVAVFGDYDVDGATSGALLGRFLRALGLDPVLYVPDRIREGYGPNAAALHRLAEGGVRLVLTVDCGTTAFEALEAAQAAGLEVVVIDHHAAEARLPPCVALVNPNRLDDPSPHKTLCAAGVVFLAVVAVNRALRASGFYARTGRAEPDLMGWLDLVALGTVCDVVPLTGLNRALVAQGLKVMARRGNAGIAALADLCKLSEKPEAYHAGFVFGPRVNAGGRVGASDLGMRLLSTDDAAEAARLARDLDVHNAERKAVEAAVLAEALERLEATAAVEPSPELVFAVGEGWHPGVIGIVAARLKERYGRPACVVAFGEDGLGKASGRSVRGVDLGAAVIAARQAGLLLAGGGHRMAAGFTVAREKLDALQGFLAARIGEQRLLDGPLVPSLELDGALSVHGATAQLCAALERLGPFGTGNAEPRFAVMDARIARADVVGQNHVRCIVTAGAGTGTRLKAIAFRALETDLGRLLLKSAGAPLHLAGYLRPDRWNGADGVQLTIEDAAPAIGTGGPGQAGPVR